MIQSDVQETAGIFRGELGWMFGPYPGLVPDLSWPSVGILDALSRDMRSRADWTEGEKLFIEGTMAHLAELIHECWTKFGQDVRIEHSNGVGIVCRVGCTDGSVFELPLERELVTTLRGAGNHGGGAQGAGAVTAGDQVLEWFALAACLGVAPLAGGRLRGLAEGELAYRLEAVVPYLARTTADYYARRHPNESLGQNPDLYMRGLIWPPPSPEGHVSREGAEGLLGHLDGIHATLHDAFPLLANLARFPSESIREAALICLSLDEAAPLSGELLEITSTQFRERAGEYRRVAIDLAAARGRDIDWLRGGGQGRARFRFERRVGLLPLVRLPYEACTARENRDLVEQLVSLEAAPAARALATRLKGGERRPGFLFQQAALRRHLGDPEAAEALLGELVRTHPESLNGEVYLEAGLNAVSLGRLDDAVTRLERAYELDAGNTQVAAALGEAYARAGRPAEAITMFSEAVAHGRMPARALVGRAEQRRALGFEEGYFRDVAAAAALYPLNPRVVEKVMAYYVAT